MEDKHKDLKEVLSLSFCLIKTGMDALEDGKIGLSDLGALFPLMKKVGPAMEGMSNIPKCIADMSSEDAEYIYEWAQQEFDLPNDNLEEIIEKGLQVVLILVSAINDLKKK